MTQRVNENDVVDESNFRGDYLGKLIFARTNDVRRKAGLPAFVANHELEAVATAHSSDMASRNYFSHITKGLLSKPDLGDRLHSGGVGYTKAAENIAMYPVVVRRLYEISSVGLTPRRVEVGRQGITYGDMAAKVMDGWMKSPGHRRNILDPALSLHTPEWLWLSTAVRSVDHAVESICSLTAQPITDANCTAGLTLLQRSLRRAQVARTVVEERDAR